jgi:hypothetical protein
VKTYLVFEPGGGGRDAAVADRVVFLREKFRWLALFFAPLWLLWNRLWIGFLLWLLAEIALSVAAYALGLAPEVAAPVLWLPTFIVAFEGTELLRRKLMRRGYREVATIVAADIEEAERRFFGEWKGAPQAASAAKNSPPPPASAAPIPSRVTPVVGLFPQPGGRT